MDNKIVKEIDLIKNLSIDKLCKKFNCNPEEICLGDYIAKATNDTVCPYKVILGFANFEGSNVESLGKLEIVYGKKLVDRQGPLTDINGNAIYLALNLANTNIEDLGNLKKVYGSLSLNGNIKSLKNIKFLGSNLYSNATGLEDLGDLEIINGTLGLDDFGGACKITSLGNVKKIGKLYINTKSLKDFGKVEEISKISVGSGYLSEMRDLIIKNFTKVNGKYVRKELNIEIQNEV